MCGVVFDYCAWGGDLRGEVGAGVCVVEVLWVRS